MSGFPGEERRGKVRSDGNPWGGGSAGLTYGASKENAMSQKKEKGSHAFVRICMAAFFVSFRRSIRGGLTIAPLECYSDPVGRTTNIVGVVSYTILAPFQCVKAYDLYD